MPSGSSRPLNAPANTSSVVGAAPATRNASVVTAMKPTTRSVRVRSLVRDREVMNDTDVYEAPMTLVIDAAHSTTPNTRRPTSPAAIWNADAAWLSGSRVAPPATTPRMARKRTTRMIPVTMIPVTEPRGMSRMCASPGTAGAGSRGGAGGGAPRQDRGDADPGPRAPGDVADVRLAGDAGVEQPVGAGVDDVAADGAADQRGDGQDVDLLGQHDVAQRRAHRRAGGDGDVGGQQDHRQPEDDDDPVDGDAGPLADED